MADIQVFFKELYRSGGDALNSLPSARYMELLKHTLTSDLTQNPVFTNTLGLPIEELSQNSTEWMDVNPLVYRDVNVPMCPLRRGLVNTERSYGVALSEHWSSKIPEAGRSILTNPNNSIFAMVTDILALRQVYDTCLYRLGGKFQIWRSAVFAMLCQELQAQGFTRHMNEIDLRHEIKSRMGQYPNDRIFILASRTAYPYLQSHFGTHLYSGSIYHYDNWQSTIAIPEFHTAVIAESQIHLNLQPHIYFSYERLPRRWRINIGAYMDVGVQLVPRKEAPYTYGTEQTQGTFRFSNMEQ